MIMFNLEIKSKASFLDELSVLNQGDQKMTILIQLLRGRLRNCQFIMEKANESVKLSD